MENDNEIQVFLDNVNLIITKYKNIIEKRESEYNIFNALKLKYSETHLHSRIIGDLLNPKGKHKKGDIFLRLFLKELGLTNFLITQSSKIKLEKDTGKIDTNKHEGGSIDIFIEDINKKAIIIENKIWAGDQKEQLLRYYNYAENNKFTYNLYYLTLFGKAPSEFSTGLDKSVRDTVKDNVKLISYKKHILNWLNECYMHLNEDSLLKTLLSQYIYLIKQLTNQKDIDMEIRNEITQSPENFEAASKISSNFKKAEKDLHIKLRKALHDKIAKKFPNAKLIEGKNGYQYITQIEFKLCDDIFFFQTSRINEKDEEYGLNKQKKFYYGFRLDNGNNQDSKYKNLKDEILKLTNEHQGGKSNFWLAKWTFKHENSENPINLEQMVKLIITDFDALLDRLSKEILEKLNCLKNYENE